MDYKEQIAYLRYLEQQGQHIEASAFLDREAAEAALKGGSDGI